MQPTGRAGPCSAGGALREGLRNVDLCGPDHEGLQPMRKSSGSA